MPRRFRPELLLLLSLLAALPAAASWEVNGNATTADFRDFSRRFSSDAYFYPRHGAAPLGILGFEAYVAGEKGMGDKTQRVGNHLVLLAQNEVGYRNLRYLSTKAFMDGFYYDPRVDKPLLRAHSEGLIALTACMAGAVPKAIRRGDMDEARREALRASLRASLPQG